MKIVVFGASGKTGALFTEQALAKGNHITAYVRRAGSLVQQHPNLKVVIGSLDNTDKLKEAISGADACVSFLGGNSLFKHSVEIINGIDKIVTILEQEGVRRFIYMSSMGAGESRKMMRYMSQSGFWVESDGPALVYNPLTSVSLLRTAKTEESTIIRSAQEKAAITSSSINPSNENEVNEYTNLREKEKGIEPLI